MDNFDKLNAEFADKGRSGFKYWFWLIISYIFLVAGVLVLIGIPTWWKDSNIGNYWALLSMLAGLFAMQTSSWAKGGGPRTKPLKYVMIAGFVILAISCVILYIVPMFK